MKNIIMQLQWVKTITLNESIISLDEEKAVDRVNYDIFCDSFSI